MIHRNYKEGQKLDVAGLNQITVLLDRSETALTEIGINEWKLEGPPHKHNDKDQIFYILTGNGIIKLGDDEYKVEPGHLIYVPAGLVHQSITIGDEPLCYVLYNIFNDSQKEGHSTFAEHIEKVKNIRKQQAESGSANVDDVGSAGNIRSPKVITEIYSGEESQFESSRQYIHLDMSETDRFEFTAVHWPAGNKGVVVADHREEQTIFVLDGEGLISIKDETVRVKTGDLVYVPRNTSHTIESLETDLKYFCLKCFVKEV